MSKQKRQTIIFVDDNPVTLNIGKNILKDFYEVYPLPSAERLFVFLEKVAPDMILLDVEMPNMNGFDTIRLLKSNTLYANIPVIFVTSKAAETDELEGLALGAVDYVTKPFSASILLKRIENYLLLKRQEAELKSLNDNLTALVLEKTARIAKIQNSIVHTVADIVEFRDIFTGGHIIRTQEFMRTLINHLVDDDTYSDEIFMWGDIDYILQSCQLHDFGKIFISDAILNKPGKLTPDEFEVMKSHTTKGVEAIRKMRKEDAERPFLKCAEIIAGTHHEKWDGSGYPCSLREENIPLLGRVMAIADVYDALSSTRPYKSAFSPETSAKIIIEGSGTHFDPAIVDVFKLVENKFADIAASHIDDQSQ